jgi:hypothetical protein
MSFTVSPKLAKALYDCQTEVAAVTKRGKNPAFRSTYAKIEDVIETLKPALEKAGLFVAQSMVPSEKSNHVAIRTVIGHFSGESVEFLSDMPYEGSGPQKAISACTYAKRTQLVSLFFLPTEDDDGNEAQKPAPKKETPPPPKADPYETVWAVAQKNGWKELELFNYIVQTFKKPSFSELTRDEQIQLYKSVSAYGPTHL